MDLAQFISKAVSEHNTSIGDNKALPNCDAFLRDLLGNRMAEIVNNLQGQIGDIPSTEEAENLLSKLVNKAREIEKPLRPQLEKLCESTVNAVLGIPQETIILDCQLVDRIEPYTQLRILPEEIDYSFDKNVSMPNNDDLLKRRIVNTMVQGIAYWLMYDSIETDVLEKWSDELLPLYDKIIALNDYLIYTKEEHITDDNPMLGAIVETHLGKDDEKTVIQSQGLIFPLLLQETYRGFFELYASHGLPEDAQQANYIIHKADFLMAEAWDLRLGTAIWDCCEKCTPKKPLNSVYPYLFTALVQLPTENFNSCLKAILSHSEEGANYIDDIVQEVMHDEEYQLFKQDIKRFNLEKCIINDGPEGEEVLDETRN